MANVVQKHSEWGSQKRTDRDRDKAAKNPRLNPRFNVAKRITPTPTYTWAGKHTPPAPLNTGYGLHQKVDSIASTAKEMREHKEVYRKEKRALERSLKEQQHKIENARISPFEKRARQSSLPTERLRQRMMKTEQAGKQLFLREKWVDSYEEDISRAQDIPRLEERLAHTTDPSEQTRLHEKIKYAEARADRKLKLFHKKTKLPAMRAMRRHDSEDQSRYNRLAQQQRNKLEISYRQGEKTRKSDPRTQLRGTTDKSSPARGWSRESSVPSR